MPERLFKPKPSCLKSSWRKPAAEVLAFAAAQISDSFGSTSNEIIVPFTIDFPQQDIKITDTKRWR